MGIIVQKYGGKLVANQEKMQQVANIIASSYDKDNKLVVVVSAIGDTTDLLNDKIFEISNNPIKREVDVVLSSGEQIAMGLLSIMLNNMGYKTVSLTGSQARIITDDNYTDSDIIKIDTSVIEKYLEAEYIVIVAGFQGVDKENNITTLGRGGSDTTATQLAVALNADVCEIYKDTKCIFTADPKVIPTAQKLDCINYKHMLELAKMGAKVLAVKSIEYASQNNLNLVIKSIEDDIIGTTISNECIDTHYPIISCTKKSYNNTMDMISFILNDNYDEEADYESIIKTILNTNNLPYHALNETSDKISILLDKSASTSILKQIHDKFIIQ